MHTLKTRQDLQSDLVAVAGGEGFLDALKVSGAHKRVAPADATVREVGEAALNKPSTDAREAPVINNYRVRDADAAEEAPSEEEFEEDLEEEVVDRDALKKHSGTILDKATKKTKKRKGKKAA